MLALLVVPVWLWVSGHVFSLLAFRGKGEPATWLTWVNYYRFYWYDETVHPKLILSAAAASALVLSPAVLLFVKPKQSLYGEARFAKRSEITKADLDNRTGDGIVIGRMPGQPNKYLFASMARHPHVMLAAPTGSGKGVGIVIPNLLNWNHSVIVLDIKKENWTLTAGYRAKHGHACFLFDPANPKRITHRWNPLAYVRDDPALRVDDTQKIGNILFPDIQGTDPIWTASCRSLFLGLTLYLLETDGKPRTLGQVAREAYSGDDKRWKRIIEERQKSGKPLSAPCMQALLDYVNTSDNTRTSIRKTFTSRFELFINPIIDAATAGNDFDLEALRKKPMSIYLGITPDNLGRLAPLLNLFFQQIIDLNTRELPEHNPALKYQLLLMPDEFRSLGKMQVLVEAIAFLRSYGVRLLAIFQSPSQVREVYGDDVAKNFFQNFHVRIIYTPADIDVATEISRELGNMTFVTRSKSRPMGFSKGSRLISDADHARALLLPQEVKDIGDDEEILLAKGCKPIMADKIRWYKDKNFKNLVCDPPVVAPTPLPSAAPIDEPHADGTRPVEVGDLETLYDRPMSDFSLNFSDVDIPSGKLTDDKAKALADRLYATITR
ncbi:type IV secretory system conjugative DNA transfer family protein [Dyella sp. M7H15-1]|uniref:type IV secretory system conjugative DNA transfer family protein n=1 Tax=Dyella sp. M7H15-1 TaxID=2501295 RepID=UPI0013E8E578|nr:type IV secretory system conjugative DNA transfer family protein [Dyella sp. M7H15-1]